MKPLSLLAVASLLFAASDLHAAEPVFRPAGPKAPFSASVRLGEVIYLSGQIGAGPDGKLVEGWEAQSRQTMDNIAAALRAEGATMDNVFKCTVMLADMARWADFNAIYVTYFKPGRLPARSALGASGLAAGAFVEVECLAAAPTSR